MGFKEAIEDRLGAAFNGLGEPMVFYPTPSVESSGAGKIVARNVLRGTVTVKDFRSRETFELPGRLVGGMQF